ncbi:hypothetical protein B0H13DRAFT_2449009 [Mycena leptocephala]|nr:hypothetical protein B0H13DRAFT_2449009 [Mycena leptocephala]
MHRHSSVSLTHTFLNRLLSVAGLWKHELCRWLYQIASVRTVTKTRAEKRRAILILALGLGIASAEPFARRFFQLADLEAGHRLPRRDIPVAIVVFHLPPPPPPSTVHCVLSIKSFYHSQDLLSTNKNLNPTVLYTNTHIVGLSPWVSWADTQSNFWRVTMRWETVAWALLFFAYFGFADEVIKNYRRAFNSVAKRMGYSTTGSGMGMGSTGATSKDPLSSSSSHGATLPVFIRKNTTQKRDSFDSFSDMSPSYAGCRRSIMTVSGMLPDYEASDYLSSPTSSSASSDTESVGGEGEKSRLCTARACISPACWNQRTRGLRLCGTRVISFDPRVRRFLH